MEKLLNIKNLLLVSKNRKLIIRLSAIIIGLNLICSFVYSQNNLVPNGSFEIYSSCPTGTFGQLNRAIPWFQPNDPSISPGGSSDFVHFCSGLTCIDVQQCPRTGNGIAGIGCFYDSTNLNRDKWREYMEVGLTDSLISEKKYCVRFYVNRANNSGWPIKQIQAVLTNDSLIYSSAEAYFISGVTPILEADSIITDTLNWTKVEATYTAIGGERFLTIGNFSPGSLVNYLIGWPYGAAFNSLGYYYFDDISIYQQPDVFAGNDTIIPPGDSTQLGTTGRPDIFYSWSPTTGLNNPNISNPMATPGSSVSYTLTVTDTNQLACANVFTDTVLVQVGFIGVDEQQNENDFGKLYPNPSNNSCTYEINLKKKESGSIELYDLNGKLLQSYKLNSGENKLEMDLSTFSNGVYMYQIIINGETVEHKKLVIQK